MYRKEEHGFSQDSTEVASVRVLLALRLSCLGLSMGEGNSSMIYLFFAATCSIPMGEAWVTHK